MLRCACVDAWAMDEITVLQAEVLRTLASPRRLEILHRLADGPCEVGRLAEGLGLSQPNVSQHLAVLRAIRARGRRPRWPRGPLPVDRPGRDGGLRHHARRPRAPPPSTGRPVIHGCGRRPDPTDPSRDPHEVDAMDEPLNLVLFSGTDDKLQAAAVLTAGAAALGKPGQHLPAVLGARRLPRRQDRP